jgi:N utilization substance protein B
MKGRRRARRLALQALYELDQSDHALEDVLRHRVVDFYLAAVEPLMAPADGDRALVLVERFMAGGAALEDAPAVATDLQLPVAVVARCQSGLTDLLPQVSYALRLTRAVAAHRDELDRVIGQIAPEWPVAQMAPVDRNILRLALWEIASASSPVRVAINEAVELARLFSGEGARRMVNGALGTFAGGKFPLELQLSPE